MPRNMPEGDRLAWFANSRMAVAPMWWWNARASLRQFAKSLEMLRVGGLLVEAGNFSDMGEISISPHRHLCAKNVRILGVGGEEPAAYGPSMRQMARYMRHYPLAEFVTHRFGLRQVDAAMKKSMDGGFHEGCDRSVVVSLANRFRVIATLTE